MRVSRALGGVTVLQKGSVDRICTNTSKAIKEQAALSQVKEGESAEELVIVDVPGGLKRCGGQGDILSGAVGTVMAWGKCYETGAFGCVQPPTVSPGRDNFEDLRQGLQGRGYPAVEDTSLGRCWRIVADENRLTARVYQAWKEYVTFMWPSLWIRILM